METQKCENFSKSLKLTKLNSVRTLSFLMPRNEIALASSISVLRKQLICQRKGLHEYYNMRTKKFDFFFFFQKKSKLNLTCISTCAEELFIMQHSSRSQHAPICRHRGCIVVPLRVDI